MSIRPYLREEPVSVSERQALWGGIQRQRSERRWRRRATVAGLALAASIAFFVAAGPSMQEPSRVVHPTLIPTTLTLPDGSRVISQPGAALAVAEGSAERIRIDLRHGQAEFDVVPNRDRVFSVLLPTVEIRVVGTRFTVVVEGGPGTQQSAVEVSHGVVEVRTLGSAELLRRIEAGGRWSSEQAAEAPRPSVEEGSAKAAGQPSTSSAEVTETGEPSTEPALPQDEPGRGTSASERAAALFDEATRARRSGDFERAMAGYELLLRRYPKDRHAALAALELGRLKRYRAEDPRGAAEALEQAADSEALGDDALAQLVLSYEQAGDQRRCRAAQRRYLERHPDGVHVLEVRSRCRGDAR